MKLDRIVKLGLVVGVILAGIAWIIHTAERGERHERDWRLATDGHFQQDFKGEKQ